MNIYNSRNCYGFIAMDNWQQQFDAIYNSRNCYGFIAKYNEVEKYKIYNSRNCYGFIAVERKTLNLLASTIVEIVMAL